MRRQRGQFQHVEPAGKRPPLVLQRGMEQRQLGRSGLLVSRLGLGCVTFDREIGETESFAVMDCAAAHGINLFDTAEAYGGSHGSSEEIIGRWMRSRRCRDRIVLQTKITSDYSPQHIAAALEASLARLGVSVVDVFLFHSFDPLSPLDRAIKGMAGLLAAGRIRAYGTSNFQREQLRSALHIAADRGLPRMETTEPMYNLACREIEAEDLPFCREQELGVTSYSPLGAGFLTGKYSPDAGAVPAGTRFAIKPGHQRIYFHPTAFQTVRLLEKLSGESGLPMAHLAMAWVLRNPDVTSVLVGARTPVHIENALEALESGLPEDVWREMNRWPKATDPSTAPRPTG